MTGRLTLRGYQETDVRRGLEEFGGKVILKHRQGLGKSVLSTRICEDDGVPHGPVVIVCRTHLIIQWIRHLRNEYPGAQIGSVVEERPGGRWRELGREAKVAMLTRRPPYDFYVLTFATIRRVKKVREAKGQRTVKEIWADVAEDKGWTESRRKKPAFEYPLPPCRSLIVDECFTAGARIATPQGERRIEEINVGDEVWGRTSSGDIVRSRVRNVFRKETDRELIPFGTVLSTPSHLVWTENRGYTPLSSMIPSDIVLTINSEDGLDGQGCSVEKARPSDVRRMWCGDHDTSRQHKAPPLLHEEMSTGVDIQTAGSCRSCSREFGACSRADGCSGEDVSTSSLVEQSVQRSCRSSESNNDRPAKGTLREEPQRREWDRSDRTATSSRDQVGVGNGGCGIDGGSCGLPSLLQSRHWSEGSENCDRGRRGRPQREDCPSERPEKGRLSEQSRMEGSSVQKPESVEGSGSSSRRSPRASVIYDLETDTANYFCEGILVHNSHHLRGRKSQQYAGAYLLAVPTKSRRAADRVVLVSTTPAWREQDDLYTQLRLLDPHHFTSYFEFIDRFCITDETDYGTKVVGGRTKRIARLLEKYAITRDYADPDVRIAVPDLIEEEVVIGLSPGGQKDYDKVIAVMAATRRAGFSPGSGVSDFSRVTAHDRAKLAALDEVLEGIEGEQYALFCKYQDTVELLSQHVGLPWFSGRTVAGSGINRYTRSEAIKRAGSFVATIGCVNEGVDLSHLRTMVFYETDFTFGAMSQVRTRLKRWRQDNSTDPVRCIYIIAASTVDDVAYERSMQRGATEQEILDEIVARAKTAEGVPHAQ